MEVAPPSGCVLIRGDFAFFAEALANFASEILFFQMAAEIKVFNRKVR